VHCQLRRLAQARVQRPFGWQPSGKVQIVVVAG
jgi:hypothetical protein